MHTTVRKIVEIDESKCDGCGQCLPGCAEGALAIVDGKARIVKDMYCDGLGACLGHCPRGALTIVEREADDFDEHAAMEHVRRMKEAQERRAAKASPQPLGCGCPGSAAMDFGCAGGLAAKSASPSAAQSALSHWPVKLRLVPAEAEFLRGADLLLVADCVPAADPAFHGGLLAGRKMVMVCPKFEDSMAGIAKLKDILRHAAPASVTIARMEVPCCAGLTAIARAAAVQAGYAGPLNEVIITRRGSTAVAERLQPLG